jgi:predicted aspartyl protease
MPSNAPLRKQLGAARPAEEVSVTEMGTFRTTVAIENVAQRGVTRALSGVLVDTGSEYTWVPREVLMSLGIVPERTQRFLVADGRAITREIGIAMVHAGRTSAPDFVVFAERGDLVLLGARSLEGLNLRIDPMRKILIDAGPIVTGAYALQAS